MFSIGYTPEAKQQLKDLKTNPSLSKRHKAVSKAIRFLAANPKHPSLNTHEYTVLSEKLGVKVWEAYAEQKTPAAYRVFWVYGPDKRQITIISISPHP